RELGERKLRHANKVTWFDEDRLSCEIVQQITQGLENSCNVVVHFMERCMDKLQSDNENFCKEDFLAAARVRKTRNTIAVVVDPAMLVTSVWRGPLQLKLGGHLYIDFTSPAAREESFPSLLERPMLEPNASGSESNATLVVSFFILDTSHGNVPAPEPKPTPAWGESRMGAHQAG
ncbi:Hypothetical Protein FCC1311_079832, partial [Hondaea fermentalgiana]